MYEEPRAFADFISKHTCVCLTATVGGGDKEPAEKTMLARLGFKIFDNVLADAEGKAPVVASFEEVDLGDNEAIY